MAGLFRRGKIYWARAQRQGREHRRSLKTTNRVIAEKRLRAWLEELEGVEWGDKPSHTFDEASAQFVRKHLTAIKPGAAKRYGVSLQNLAMHFGGMPLHKIGKASLSDFVTARRLDGVTSGTIRRDLACLSSLLTSAEEWEWLDDGSNPVPGFLRRQVKRGLKEAPPRTRYLSEAEEAALLAEASPDCRAAIILSIETGLRLDELFSLKWEQIDYPRGLIRTTTKTKSGRMRLVPLTDRSRTILGTVPRDLVVPYVFVSPKTGTRYVQMNKGFQGAARRAGIKAVRWHDLRRTAGCRWLQRDGRSMEEVSMLLGHSSVTVTEQRYAFLDAEAVASRTFSGTGTADSGVVIPMKQGVKR